MDSQSTSEKSENSVRTPRLQRGKTRVAALMAAGAAVFAEKGYDAATMTEIAARAGASIGSLYQFFPTKELLATSLHADQFAILQQMLDTLRRDAAGLTAGTIIERLFTGLAQFLDNHPAFIALADRRDIDKTRKQASRTQMLGHIAALLTHANPPLPPARSEAMAALILQLMKAMVALSAHEDEPTRSAALAELRQMLRRHLDAGAVMMTH